MPKSNRSPEPAAPRSANLRATRSSLMPSAESRLLFDAIPVPACICERDSNALLLANPHLATLSGYATEQLRSMSLAGLVSPRPLAGPARLTTASGETIAVEIAASPFEFAGRPATLVVLMHRSAATSAADVNESRLTGVPTDITHAREPSEPLAPLAQIIEAVEGAIVSVDLDWRIKSWNRGAERLFGHSAADALGQDSRVLLGTLNDPDAESRRSRLAAGEVLGEVEHASLDPASGETRTFASSSFPLNGPDGRVTGYATFTRDVTESKHAEQLLRQGEKRFRSLVDNSPDYITRIDRNLRHVFVNATAQRDAGLVAAQILGKRADEIGYPPEIGALRVARHQQVLDSGEPIEFEYHLAHGGQVSWRRCRLLPEFDDAGAVEHVLSVVTDLTAEKRAEEERRRLDLQVQNAQKLESLGILAGGIAHDFNNLLVAILGNAGLALMELSPESPARQTVQAIEVAAQRAADLTQQMLAYSGKGRFVIEMLNLSSIVDEMSHLLEVSISRRARIEYHFAPGLPAIEADATQIRQVIMNLITNASDAVAENGGVISLRTGLLHANAGYLAHTYIDSDLPEGDYVFVEVADTGGGMDEDTRQRIFDPFFTTKFTGRGLGLAAVLGIVRGHKGAIKLESTPGKGTTFTVLLPAAATPATVASGDNDHMTGRPNTYSATVLFADDDETVRTVTRRILEHSGYSVLVAADGRDALDLYIANHDTIDIVLLDMTMPRMDGEETFRELRRVDPAVRVLLTSGYNEQDATERFAGKGLLGFIQKPYRPDELIDRIEAALAI